MTIAKPYIDARALLQKPPKTEKELMEERIKNRLLALQTNVDSYKRSLKQHEEVLDVFISEVENCMDESELKKLVSRKGI